MMDGNPWVLGCLELENLESLDRWIFGAQNEVMKAIVFVACACRLSLASAVGLAIDFRLSSSVAVWPKGLKQGRNPHF